MRSVWKSVLMPRSLAFNLLKRKSIPSKPVFKRFYIRKSFLLNKPLIGSTIIRYNGRYNIQFSVQPRFMGCSSQNFIFTKKFSPIHSGTAFVFSEQRNLKKSNRKVQRLKNQSVRRISKT